MKICIITSANFPPEEGIGNYIYNMSQELIRKKHQVTIITRGNFRRTYREYMDNIELYRVPFIPIYPFHVHVHGIFVENFFKTLKRDYDIVHFHTPLPPPIKTGLPAITTVHTPMKTDTSSVEIINPFSIALKMQGKISYLIEKELFKLSDKVTSVAASVSNELVHYGLNPEDVDVIGNGVDEKIFKPIKKDKEEKYILYTGRLSYRKGLFDLIECAKRVCSRHPDVNFKLTGRGPLLEKLKRDVIESGYSDKIRFLGYVEKIELIKLYQNAELFVLPSHYEGLPTTLLEAMSCGLPVVATSVSGNLDVIEDGKNGLMVPIKSPLEISERISYLLDNEHIRENLGTEARRTIEQKFTWDKVSNRILNSYEHVLRKI